MHNCFSLNARCHLRISWRPLHTARVLLTAAASVTHPHIKDLLPSLTQFPRVSPREQHAPTCLAHLHFVGCCGRDRDPGLQEARGAAKATHGTLGASFSDAVTAREHEVSPWRLRTPSNPLGGVSWLRGVTLPGKPSSVAPFGDFMYFLDPQHRTCHLKLDSLEAKPKIGSWGKCFTEGVFFREEE